MSSATDLERLEARIRTAEANIAKAEGAMEQIADQWERTFGTRDPKEVANILAQQEKQLEILRREYDTACNDAQAILDRAGVL